MLIGFDKGVHNWWHNAQRLHWTDENMFKGWCCLIAVPTWKGTYGTSTDFDLSACLFCTVSAVDNYKAMTVISCLLLLIWKQFAWYDYMALAGYRALPAVEAPCRLHSV